MEEVAASPVTGGREEDDEHDSKERVMLKYFLKEWELVKSLLDGICANGGVADPADVQKIRSILEKYQQQGELLEPYLESIVSPLMSIVRSRTLQLGVDSEEVLQIIMPLCIIIYTLVTVSGYKSVIKFFPHQVSDLELAVSLLEKCHTSASNTSLRHESTGEMETKCVVLLWLYILVLIPFDISSIDTNAGESKYIGGLEPSPLVLKLLGFSKDYLSSPGPMRRISCLLLARLITRPDMPSAFHRFLSSFSALSVMILCAMRNLYFSLEFGNETPFLFEMECFSIAILIFSDVYSLDFQDITGLSCRMFLYGPEYRKIQRLKK